MLVVVQGHHGYVSPSWYADGDTSAPTWNFTTAHLHGVPEVLDAATNLAVLTRLVEHFEQHVEEPVLLDQEFGAQLARGTVGLRMPVSRVICKVKIARTSDEVSQPAGARACAAGP